MDKTFKLIGAHGTGERQKDDYYATDPKALEALLEVEEFSDVWECACGGGHLSSLLEERGLLKRKSDIIDRGCGAEILDFLNGFGGAWDGDIVTNPPYARALEFVKKALSAIHEGRKAAFLLRLQFLEGAARRALFDKEPPKTVWVFTRRILCAKNGDFETYDHSAMCYAWFVWEKGYKGDATVRWL